jgi:hypothetical protein
MRTPEEQIELDTYVFHFFFNHGLFDELKHLEDLITETDLYLKSKLIEATERASFEDTDSRFGKVVQFGRVFPDVLYKSLFLHFYSVLEDSLNQICDNLQDSQLYNLSPDDMAGRGITKSKIYLEKVCGLKSLFKTKSWNDIQQLNRVRNIIIHADGFIDKENKKDLNTCRNISDISVSKYRDDGHVIGFGKEFCFFALSEIDTFFNSLYESMLKMDKRPL